MDYITELRMHYEGVKRRLHGLSGPTGLRVPKPPAPPVEKTAPETVFVIDTPRSRFVKMLKEVAAMHGIDPAEVMEIQQKSWKRTANIPWFGFGKRCLPRPTMT